MFIKFKLYTIIPKSFYGWFSMRYDSVFRPDCYAATHQKCVQQPYGVRSSISMVNFSKIHPQIELVIVLTSS